MKKKGQMSGRVMAASLAVVLAFSNSGMPSFAMLAQGLEKLETENDKTVSTPSEAVKVSTPSQADGVDSEASELSSAEEGTSSEGEELTVATSSVAAVSSLEGSVEEMEEVSWDLTGASGILKDESGSEVTKLEKNKGTFENEDGAAFSVDATAGKLSIDGTGKQRTQINSGTVLQFQAAGDVCFLQITAHKALGADSAAATAALLVTDDGKSCEAESVEKVDGDYNTYTYRCVSAGVGEDLAVVFNSQAYVKEISISSTESETVEVSGTFSMKEGTSGTGKLNVIFKNQRTGEEFSANLSMSGGSDNYDVTLPKYADEENYLIIVDSDKFALAEPNVLVLDSDSPIEENDYTLISSEKYKVTLKFSSDIDTDGFEYCYTDEDTQLEYVFDSEEEILLKDGTYTLSLEGNAIKLPYEISSGSQITVQGMAVTQKIYMELITEWNFYADGTDNYYKETIEKGGTETGYFRGLYIDTSDGGKLAPNGGASSANSGYFTTGAKISVPVTGACKITVNSYKNTAQYTNYTIDGETVDQKSPFTYDYEGEAGYADIVSTGTSYIESISMVYPSKEVDIKEQTQMPFTATDFGTADNLTVAPEGQTITLTQTGGSMNSSDLSGISYYVFPKTADWETFSADVVLEKGSASNYSGIFFGAFDGKNMTTVGIRNKTVLRGIYSKKDTELAGAGKIEESINEKEKVSFTVVKTSEGYSFSYETKSGTTGNAVFKYSDSLLSKTNGENTECYYGFVLADVTASVTNMILTDEEGEILYDQNDCYEPEGEAPVATEITAEADNSREYIQVDWKGDDCEGDGKYVLQVSRTGEEGDWEDVTDDLTERTYQYSITGSGDWYFRVCGTLGNNPSEEDRNDWVTVTEPVSIVAALPAPVLTAEAGDSSIQLTWDMVDTAEKYEIYRYSYDETETGAKLLATVSDLKYTDETVQEEMPYYYYMKSYSADNSSNNSETVWAVAVKERQGEYTYEDEAISVVITKKSYDTSYQSGIIIEGIAEEACTLEAEVNGSLQGETKQIKSKGSFHLDLTLLEGRNDVNLLFTDSDGKVTRKTFNYIYLTQYDMVVDASFSGTDGEKTNGIPVFKTVQAAVDSVSSDSEERCVILVKEGSYREHLVVDKPYISLVGEDRDKVNIHFYDKTESPEGGDMKIRCAVRIAETAIGFSAENLTFENDYNYTGTGSNESADALRNDAEGAVYVNVGLTGYQDTLCANGGTQYYYKCRITGNVDFIYGNEPRALFNDCDLVFRYNGTKNSGYLTAPKTSADAKYGLTFDDCRILSEEGCSGNKYLLGRPWGANGFVTFIDCYMGSVINGETAYDDMSGNSFMNARFFEYGSYGPSYVINENRRQISPTKAAEMLTTSVLGWDPESSQEELSGDYTGNIVTDEAPKYVITSYSSDTYSQEDGDDTGLGSYKQEGYAQSASVTGGGLLMETSENYYTVSDAEGFLKALQTVKSSGEKSVIELTQDIGLGSKEVDNFTTYNDMIKEYSAQPLTHPELKETGTSVLMLTDISNLTIFSRNGAGILHANVDIKNSENIIIRNLVFDELWEWDEDTEGDYDRNDWDYMTIESESTNIWIDHCTFYKAYDGVVDIKDPSTSRTSNITISWCSFLPGSRDDFFDQMMDEIVENPEKYPYYSHLKDDLGMTEEQIYMYAYGQKKTHLLGQDDKKTNAKNIRLTLANNYYKDSMDRMPRLRYGDAHVYNCILDADDLYQIKKTIINQEAAQKIVSNGASSTCNGQVLLENCYIDGIVNALNSGNGSSPSGYINAINSSYYLDGVKTKLEAKVNSSIDTPLLILDADEFKSSLPYDEPVLYDAEDLKDMVIPFAGAGTLEMTVLQWEKTVYYDSEVITDPEPEEPVTDPGTEPQPEEPGTVPGTEVEPEPEESSYYDDDEDEYKEEDQEAEKAQAAQARKEAVEIRESDNGTWLKFADNTWSLVKKDGTLAKDEWVMVNGTWYYFGTAGIMATGWINVDGKWYYLDKSSGACLLDGVTPDGYSVDKNGMWIQE